MKITSELGQWDIPKWEDKVTIEAFSISYIYPSPGFRKSAERCAVSPKVDFLSDGIYNKAPLETVKGEKRKFFKESLRLRFEKPDDT